MNKNEILPFNQRKQLAKPFQALINKAINKLEKENHQVDIFQLSPK